MKKRSIKIVSVVFSVAVLFVGHSAWVRKKCIHYVRAEIIKDKEYYIESTKITMIPTLGASKIAHPGWEVVITHNPPVLDGNHVIFFNWFGTHVLGTQLPE